MMRAIAVVNLLLAGVFAYDGWQALGAGNIPVLFISAVLCCVYWSMFLLAVSCVISEAADGERVEM